MAAQVKNRLLAAAVSKNRIEEADLILIDRADEFECVMQVRSGHNPYSPLR